MDQPHGLSDLEPVDLAEVVDEGPLTPRRALVLALLLLAFFTDGYDSAVVSFIAPAVTASWRLRTGAVGGVFTAGLAGMIIGALAMGVFADWRGRRPALLGSLMVSGVGMLGSATATSVSALAAWRFFAGLGVGAIVPVGLVLAAELAPRRVRATVLSLLLVGLGAGGTGVAGWLASAVMPSRGWGWLLQFGGAATLASTAVLAAAAPESLKFLFARRPTGSSLWRTVLRFDPSLAPRAGAPLVWSGETPQPCSLSVRALFADQRVWITPIIWLALFSAQVTVYALALWLPTLLASAGVRAGAAALGLTLFAASAAIGALVFGRLVDRYGPIALAVLPFSGVPVLIGLASAGADPQLLIPLVALSGISVNGALQGLLVIIGQFYPTAQRAYGVGTAVFVSRFGSLIGPAALGLLLARGAGLRTVFYACTAPLLVTGVGIVALGVLHRRATGGVRAL